MDILRLVWSVANATLLRLSNLNVFGLVLFHIYSTLSVDTFIDSGYWTRGLQTQLLDWSALWLNQEKTTHTCSPHMVFGSLFIRFQQNSQTTSLDALASNKKRMILFLGKCKHNNRFGRLAMFAALRWIDRRRHNKQSATTFLSLGEHLNANKNMFSTLFQHVLNNIDWKNFICENQWNFHFAAFHLDGVSFLESSPSDGTTTQCRTEQ